MDFEHGLILALMLGACGSQEQGPTIEETSDTSPSREESSSDTSSTDETSTENSSTETTGEPTIPCDDAYAAALAAASAYRESEGLRGLSISVSVEGCEPWSEALGLANSDNSEELTTAHLLRSGSLTKSYTAALVLKLEEEGLLSLDETLSEWGIDFPEDAEITIRQLLNQTSGVAGYGANPEFVDALIADPTRVWLAQELVDYAKVLPAVDAPGEQHIYENTNYILAGLVAEAASDQSYAAALRERVLEPLGLEHTYVEGDETFSEAMATGYFEKDPDGITDTTGLYHASIFWASGAMVSTSEDTRSWIDALLATDFLSPESQDELVTFVDAWPADGYGLGIFKVVYGNVTAYGHNGAVMGFASAAYYDPSTGVTAAVIHNHLRVDEANQVEVDPTLLVFEILGDIENLQD